LDGFIRPRKLRSTSPKVSDAGNLGARVHLLLLKPQVLQKLLYGFEPVPYATPLHLERFGNPLRLHTPVIGGAEQIEERKGDF
jgi:hypothetical protein